MRPNIDRTCNCNSSSGRNSVFYALQERMRSLSFLPFQTCVVLWLGVKGLRSIRSLGRIHRRGRRELGGADFLAKSPGNGVEVAIQIRHWRTPLQRRVVDELWGFMLRHGIPAGLVICSSGVMRAAETAAAKYPGRPIELIPCELLCSSMVALELGVSEQNGRWILNEAFFRSAHQLALANVVSTILSTSSTAKNLTAESNRSKAMGMDLSPVSASLRKVGPVPTLIWVIGALLLLLLWWLMGVLR